VRNLLSLFRLEPAPAPRPTRTLLPALEPLEAARFDESSAYVDATIVKRRDLADLAALAVKDRQHGRPSEAAAWLSAGGAL